MITDYWWIFTLAGVSLAMSAAFIGREGDWIWPVAFMLTIVGLGLALAGVQT